MTGQDADPIPPNIDWANVPEPMARQIVHQAETFMQTQFQAALASDSRAMTMASVLVTLATAILAGALAYWDKTGSLPILVGGVVGATVMLLGASLGVWAARPVDFYYPGNQPESWFPIRNGDLVEALGGEAENYASHIDTNEKILTANNAALKWGAIFAVLSPVAGLLASVATYLFCPA